MPRHHVELEHPFHDRLAREVAVHDESLEFPIRVRRLRAAISLALDGADSDGAMLGVELREWSSGITTKLGVERRKTGDERSAGAVGIVLRDDHVDEGRNAYIRRAWRVSAR